MKGVERVVAALLLALACPAWADPATVYVVRHAEKQVGPDAPRDPPLTEAGRRRAQALARLLSDVELVGVYSTDTARTRATAEPTARAHKLSLTLYDPAAPGELAGSIRARGGAWLVVGHSNTVPGIVEALGGPGGPDLADGEYDRLTVVFLPDGGPPVVQVLRYGEPSAP